MRQAIIWTNVDPIHWRIYAALGGDELIENVYDYDKREHLRTLSHYICTKNERVWFLPIQEFCFIVKHLCKLNHNTHFVIDFVILKHVHWFHSDLL